MRLTFDPHDEPRVPGYHPKPWTATSDDGEYVGRGVTDLDAVADLAEKLERAMLKSLEGK